MTLQDIEKNDLLQTRSIAEDTKNSIETKQYIYNCIKRFFSGDYGEIPEEDIIYNNADLENGEGHILARYKARYNLKNDIYIESYFSNEMPGIETNHTMIMYCEER